MAVGADVEVGSCGPSLAPCRSLSRPRAERHAKRPLKARSTWLAAVAASVGAGAASVGCAQGLGRPSLKCRGVDAFSRAFVAPPVLSRPRTRNDVTSSPTNMLVSMLASGQSTRPVPRRRVGRGVAQLALRAATPEAMASSKTRASSDISSDVARIETQPPVCPVEMRSAGGLRAVEAITNEETDAFEVVMAEELQKLRESQEHMPARGGVKAHHEFEETDSKEWYALHSLRRRINEVESEERIEAAAELIYARVVSGFKSRLKVGMLPRIAEAAAVGGVLDLTQVSPKRLVGGDLYSDSSLGLIREHVMSIMSEWEHLDDSFPLRFGLSQLSQVYTLSAFLGYYVRRVDLRYRLDRAAGSYEAIRAALPELASPEENLDGLGASVSATIAEQLRKGPGRAALALKRYVAGFGQEELLEATKHASHEAHLALLKQVGALFGHQSLRVNHATEEMHLDEVDTAVVTVGGLKRVLLEAVAFGTLLGVSEEEVAAFYELSKADEQDFVSAFEEAAWVGFTQKA